MTTAAMAGFVALDEAECLVLLDRAGLGHVAVTIGALPAIFPVNFGVIAGQIMFFTGDGARAVAALSETVVAFETDWHGSTGVEGWSVEVVGVASVIFDPVQIEVALGRGLRPWVPSSGARLVAVQPGSITGRRVPGPSVAA